MVTVTIRRVWTGIILVLTICWLTLGSAAANSGISQGYTTTETNLTPGTLMGLSDNNTATPATSGRSYQLLGLVANAPLLALNDGNHQVQIIINGTAVALVSDINGTVKAGDRITASPVRGVGMKATEAGQIVGTAQTPLSKNELRTQTITDKNGKAQTIKLGYVTLQVSVSYFTGVEQGGLANVLPPFIMRTATNLAGQQVSPLRVLVALLVLIFGFVIVGVMLQAAIRSTITAMGRNPLAKRSLFRELMDVSLTALGVLIVTTLVVYMVIKL